MADLKEDKNDKILRNNQQHLHNEDIDKIGTEAVSLHSSRSCGKLLEVKCHSTKLLRDYISRNPMQIWLNHKNLI